MPIKITRKQEQPSNGEVLAGTADEPILMAGYTPKKKQAPGPQDSTPAPPAGKATASSRHLEELVHPSLVKTVNGRNKAGRNEKVKRVVIRTGARKTQTLNLSTAELDQLLEDTGVPRNDALVSQAGLEVPEGQKRIRATREGVEYRRKQILRLMLRSVPKQTIAEHLGLSIRQVYEDCDAINSDMKAELQRLDVPTYIGMSLAFYDEARTIALRMATDNAKKKNGDPVINPGNQMAALRTALAAEDSKHTFLTRVGLFKVVAPTDPFPNIQTGRQGSYSDENDMNRVMQSIAQLANGTVDVVAKEVLDAGQ